MAPVCDSLISELIVAQEVTHLALDFWPSGRTLYGTQKVSRKVLMTALAARAYTSLQADERQEIRLPKLLKAHLSEAARLQGETVTKYVIEAVAERVTRDLASATWELPVPEQKRLLEILAQRPAATPAFLEAMRRADALFGPMPTAR